MLAEYTAQPFYNVNKSNHPDACLNLYSDVCQLLLNKTGGGGIKFKTTLQGILGVGSAVWRLPLAQGVILESQDRVPCRAPCIEPASPSACVSASLSLSLWVSHE